MTNDIAKSVPNLLLVENHEPLRSLWSGLLRSVSMTLEQLGS